MSLSQLKPKTLASLVLALLLYFLSILFQQLKAQPANYTQQIRGVVVDKVSTMPLSGAVIRVINTNPIIGGTTDEAGKFKIDKIPVGKINLKISYTGYKEQTLNNLTLNAGKELVLTISLEENLTSMQELVVKANADKDKPLNSMSVVSTRSFSVEETQKFAAAVNDPGRMATSFAGVIGGDGGNNAISIRGNSPNAVLWRMEGVDIPNPNHFANVGTAGGAVSILSAQLLSNSDFSTGAFASEYGNALGGVFDLRLRKGNNQKREYTFQASMLGLDFATEGPFKKGYDGSYLINYRYSTLGLLSNIGVPIGDASTVFQDLSWNVHLPTQKFGTFGVFGFVGLSSQTSNPKKDSNQWKDEPYYQYQSSFYSNTFATGLNHTFQLNKSAYIKSVFMVSGNANAYTDSKLGLDYETLQLITDDKYLQNKYTLSSTLTKKINVANNIRVGIIANNAGFNLLQKRRIDSLQTMKTQLDSKGSALYWQGFFQWNHQFNEKASANVGFHFLNLLLNQTSSLEPRASFKYLVSTKQSIALAYGLHSQINPVGLYFMRSPTNEMPNKNLELSKANHFVLSHTYQLSTTNQLKTEVYMQYLKDIPVSVDLNNTYSLVNEVGGYAPLSLNNKGAGRNYGIDISLERFTFKDFYYLLTTSIYQSEYRASNGQWYNTRFNTNYAVNITAGKEWRLKNKTKQRVLGANIKLTQNGGFRYTPIDLEASLASDGVVEDLNQSFAKQNPGFFRLDTRVSLKRNYSKMTGTLALDLQNASNHKNVGGQYFDANSGTIKYWYMSPLIPILSYRLEF